MRSLVDGISLGTEESHARHPPSPIACAELGCTTRVGAGDGRATGTGCPRSSYVHQGVCIRELTFRAGRFIFLAVEVARGSSSTTLNTTVGATGARLPNHPLVARQLSRKESHVPVQEIAHSQGGNSNEAQKDHNGRCNCGDSALRPGWYWSCGAAEQGHGESAGRPCAL